MTSSALLQPLKIACTDFDCGNKLHCFLQKKKRGDTSIRRGGPCRACGAELVEWERVTARNIDDVEYTFGALRHEMIRHEFWHRRIDQRAINYARRKGRVLLRVAAADRIKKSVGNAKNVREGRQTPFEGNILYYAQHAVAACCRKCIEYWHGIPLGRRLLANEVQYLVELVMLYVDERLPNLADGAVKVPPIRKK